jgi:hypothetical protein
VYALHRQIVPATRVPSRASVRPRTLRDRRIEEHSIYRRSCQDCHGTNLHDDEFERAPTAL